MMAALTRPETLRDLAGLLEARAPAGVPAALPMVGLADDSREVRAGEVFFARRGTVSDGAAFVRSARARGAVAIVSERPVDAEVPTLLVPDVEAALRTAADAWYGRPQDDLDLIGITGTKGKTTTAWITAGALRAAGRKPALLGTIAHDVGDGRPEPSRNTTPGVLTPAPTARTRPRCGVPQRRLGDLESRPRSASHHRARVSRRRVHEPRLGPPRLPRGSGGVR